MMFVLTFYSTKNPEKKLSEKIWSCTSVFIIDNNHKCFLNSESMYRLQDWSNDAENTALIAEINSILKYIQKENSYFKW